SVAGISSGPDAFSNALVAQIVNGGGSVGGNAIINFAASGSVDAHQGGAIFQILNNDNGNGNGGGSIDGNAEIDVNAANITANSLVAQIDNTGGSIGASTEG